MDLKKENRLFQFKNLFQSMHNLFSKSDVELLSLASKFNKIEQEYVNLNSDFLIKKKIAIVASYTTYHWLEILKLFLYANCVSPTFYEAEYDSINMEILDDTSELYHFQPDILFIGTHHKDIKKFPELFSTADEIDKWLETHKNNYLNLWSKIKSISGCQIIHSLFAIPFYRQNGVLENNYLFTKESCLKKLNYALTLEKPAHVTLVDMDYFSALFGKINWFDEVNYYISKQGYSMSAFPLTANTIARLIACYCGKTKKCLVLDLDNTLWGGVIGDDGLDGINLDPNNAVGEAYIAFQRYVKLLKERGIILAVCSKNEEETAKQAFLKHPDMILKLDDIACFIANWEDKAGNVKKIANFLNIGIDSLVFFDDNPAEREIIRKFLPQVEVIEVPEDPAHYIRALELSGVFEMTQLSREDLSRADSYIADFKRAELQEQFVDYDSYLQSLEMSGIIAKPGNAELSRFVQLINKSNQFNLRTRRYTDATAENMLNSNEFKLAFCSLKDKFTNYGIISSLILKKIDIYLFIDTWVMSCRVLKRGVEQAVFNYISDMAKKSGCKKIIGEYIPTAKNKMVESLLNNFGFNVITETKLNCAIAKTEQNSILYEINIKKIELKKHFIKI